MVAKPKRVLEIERSGDIKKDKCLYIGGGTYMMTDKWTIWKCPMKDGGVTLVQEFYRGSSPIPLIDEIVMDVNEVRKFCEGEI